MCIGWTTFQKHEEAEKCATELVSLGLAFCVQVENPVESHYMWKEKAESTREYPVRIKYIEKQGSAIQGWLKKNHPYETPQWIAIKACDLLEEYYQWALQDCVKV